MNPVTASSSASEYAIAPVTRKVLTTMVALSCPEVSGGLACWTSNFGFASRSAGAGGICYSRVPADGGCRAKLEANCAKQAWLKASTTNGESIFLDMASFGRNQNSRFLARMVLARDIRSRCAGAHRNTAFQRVVTAYTGP